MRKYFTLLISAMVSVLAIAQGVEPTRGSAQATLEPHELFMTAVVGDTAIAYLTLTNTGTVTISPLWSFSSDYGFLWCDGYNGDIPPAPGDNVRQIPVTYTPTLAGTHTGHLSMYLDGEFYDVYMTGEAIEPAQQVTATPVITVEEHIPNIDDYDEYTYENYYYDSYVTITATGDGDVCLYVNGRAVANPYDIYCSDEPQYVYVTATAQEEGKLISETAELDYLVPSWNQLDMVSPVPEIVADYVDEGVLVTGVGTGEVTLYMEGAQVENPFLVPFSDQDQYYTFMAVNQEEGKLPSMMVSYAVSVPGIVEPYDPYQPNATLTYIVTGENEAAVSGASWSLTDAAIPETVEINGKQYTVTAIHDYAFYCNRDITSVSIPATVVSIGGNAFTGAENLVSITVAADNPVLDSRNNCNAIIETATNTLIVGCQATIIPETVTTIGKEAFEFQENLTAITIPNSVTLIKERAFVRTGLRQLTIPGSVTTIESSAFDSCSQLTSLNMEEGVERIGGRVFFQCTKLPGVTIPSSVTSIGSSVFLYCYAISEMSVESGNTVYDSRNGCNAIIETATNTLVVGCQSTQIPATVTAIGEHAFSSCINLTSIEIPSSVTSIGEYAFSGCSNLQSFVIPNSVKEIGMSAFNSCKKLEELVIPNSVTSMGIGVFSFCEGLTSLTIGSGLDTIPSSTFANCKSLTQVEIPNTVRTIGPLVFSRCTGLQHVSIPASVTSIGNYVFDDCENLESIVVDSDNPIYDSRDNCNALIKTSSQTLIRGCRTTKIPEGVRVIDVYAFDNTKGLTTVKIPNSVRVISSRAFAYCYDLADVEIGSGLLYIEDWAFLNCKALANVTCWAATPPTIQKDDVFDCFENYETAVLHVPQESLSAYQADDEWGKFTHITSFIGGGPGDLNGDGALDVDDVIGLIGMLLDGGQLPAYADLNGDGVPDIDDVTLLISMLLNGH